MHIELVLLAELYVLRYTQVIQLVKMTYFK